MAEMQRHDLTRVVLTVLFIGGLIGSSFSAMTKVPSLENFAIWPAIIDGAISSMYRCSGVRLSAARVAGKTELDALIAYLQGLGLHAPKG